MLVKDDSFSKALSDSAPDDAPTGRLVSQNDVAMIVHELRNPLLAILGYSRMLADPLASVPGSEVSRRIADTGAHMLTLVNDLLELSRSGSARVDLRQAPVNTLRLMTDSLSVVEIMAQSKSLLLRLDLDYGFPLEFVGDPQRLRQILINLLSNAVKFTPRGTITLQARLDMATSCLCFSVIDEGIGMTEAEVLSLFQPFSQVQQSMQTGEGTGLGLAISRNLAQAMGGSIAVVSTPGKGSTFTFTLPYRPRASLAPSGAAEAAAPTPPAEARAAAPSAPADPAPLLFLPPQRCLVVDDSDLLRELIISILRRAGHRVDGVSSGAEALCLAQAGTYDLVLIDSRMRDMDGFETARRIRKLHAGRSGAQQAGPVLIGLSAVVTDEDRAEAKAAGLTAIFAKTESPLDLIHTITRIVQEAQPR